MSEDLEEAATVLVVDDNPLITNVVRSLLLAERYNVLIANNGEEGLALLNAHDVDVIVCDVMMPRMDGYDFQRRVRGRPELAHIPFIFLSALGDNLEVNRGRESGADDYLVKPFDPRTILSIIKGKVIRSRALKAQVTHKYESYRRKVVNTLSHEFRTPLVAINTGAELLIDHGKKIAPEKAQQLLEAVRRGGQRLERLVNDFMLLQQIDAGTGAKLFEQRARPTKVRAFAERFLEFASDDIARDKFSVQLEHECPEDVEVRLYEPYAIDILNRVLQNALKFSGDSKEILVRTAQRGEEALFEFLDRGIGIDLTRLKEALALFGQIDRERMEQQGSGVGLTIAARFAQIHGGGLEFQPRPGGGSIVRLVLPVYRAPELAITEIKDGDGTAAATERVKEL